MRDALGENLFSCCLYGSAVRGNFLPGASDINLLILLHDSSPAAHRTIAKVLEREDRVDPFILGRSGLARSVRCFANKFASIRRNYRVLHGADPFAELPADPAQQRFLCEQSLRNLRLRMVYAFVTRRRHRRYDRYVAHCVTPLFCQLSDVLRLADVEVPTDFAARIPVFEREFKIDGAVLRDVFAFKASPSRLSDAEAETWHERLFGVVDKVVKWVETRWSP